jgi:hypothetical protein
VSTAGQRGNALPHSVHRTLAGLHRAQTNGECKMTSHNDASRTTLKMYRVVVSLDVEAIDAESAIRQAMEIVHDNSMIIESVREESRT